jgi:hypothetical protein
VAALTRYADARAAQADAAIRRVGLNPRKSRRCGRAVARRWAAR